MTARKSILGLSLLAVLAFCAIAAQGASAAWKEATNTTAITCGPSGGSLDFSDSHCDKQVPEGTGSFGHVEIAKDTSTDIEIAGVGNSRLKAKAAGLKVNIACKKALTDPTPTSFIKNTEPEANIHKVNGTVAVTFEDCKEEGELAALGCQPVEPITVASVFKGVEEPEKGTMALEFTPDGSENFAELTYKAGCLIGTGPFPVKGSMKGTPAGVEPNQRWSGATVKFEPGNEMESLKFGGEKAEFEATFTMKMKEGNPIALTTPTG
jgi:hypothetical protein